MLELHQERPSACRGDGKATLSEANRVVVLANVQQALVKKFTFKQTSAQHTNDGELPTGARVVS